MTEMIQLNLFTQSRQTMALIYNIQTAEKLSKLNPLPQNRTILSHYHYEN
jgi:hypothetical protein